MSLTDKNLKVVAERPTANSAIATATTTRNSQPQIFTADNTETTQSSGPRAHFLADLALSRSAATPLCVGLFGPAGVGKSTLLTGTLQAVEKLDRAADAAGLATPFLSGVATLRISAEPRRDPYAALAQRAADGLGRAFPGLASAAFDGLDDPHATARDADDRLSSARHRLDEERRRLDELSARQARLVDTVLFEGAGSSVDAYTRANRGRIDRTLRRFGFSGDTAVVFKELVRDAAEPGFGRAFGWLSAFWAYRGQVRLLLVGAGFFLAAWLVGLLQTDADGLLSALRTSNDKMVPASEWLASHAGWLNPARQVLNIAGVVAIAMNIFRAIRFIQPVARGATLLRSDLDGRRRDVDGLIAHQAQRVEALARDVENANVRAAEAERRLSGGNRIPLPAALIGDKGPAAAAQAVFAHVSDAIRTRDASDGSGRVPSRLIVAIDGLERLDPPAAAEFMEAVHLCCARPGIVTFIAADAEHLASGLAETDPAHARAVIDRVVQVPLHLRSDSIEPRKLAQALLHQDETTTPSDLPVEAGRSAFEKPWLPKEAAVLEALAPFAGSTPRAIKRFVNLYRVARADPALEGAGAADLAALALSLALAHQGALPPDSVLQSGAALTGEVQAARHAASTALGVAIDLDRERRGVDTARRYSGL